MDELRARRVAERMREELSEMIRFESGDPRLAGIEVTEVILGSGMRRADVLVSLPAGQEERAEALAGLEHARHFLRRMLMQRLDLFRMPELRFVPDSDSSGTPMGKLLRRARRGRSQNG
jgi:ribosome-binding factor A